MAEESPSFPSKPNSSRDFYFRYEIMVYRSTSIKYQFIPAELFRRQKARVICDVNFTKNRRTIAVYVYVNYFAYLIYCYCAHMNTSEKTRIISNRKKLSNLKVGQNKLHVIK